MTAYVIGHITINNVAKWQEYRSQVPDTLTAWGGELVLRGTNAEVMSGQFPHTDTVVIRFPDRESAVAWHHSPQYQELVALREEAANVDLVSYEADA